ncbi:MAG: hypothetical protein KTR33_09520 [Gammaproteobacteria bacterium]|nr:hypothetical protein [Gammaproteobacteria bacterium]
MTKYSKIKFTRVLTLGCAAALVLLAGCSSSDDDDAISNTGLPGDPFLAFTSVRDSGYTVSKLERLSVTPEATTTASFTSVQSDYLVATDGDAVYHIGRFQIDSITKFDAQSAELIYQRSVAGEEASANPYDIVFASETKAYVIRYGSNRIWIVDPTATTDEAFKLGELDLSSYADSDGLPEANGAVIVGEKLFVLMQRLESFSPTQPGYLAVFDTSTDQEINTGAGTGDGLNGIPLSVHNPSRLQYLEADGQLYVLGTGNSFAVDDSAGNRFTGGVESIDAETYATELVLDDGDEAQNEGFLTELEVVSPTKAYVVTQVGFADNTLRVLNLLTGELDAGAAAGLASTEITLLAEDPAGRLWVGVNELPLPGFRVIDPADDAQELGKMSTDLIPQDLVFIQPVQ